MKKVIECPECGFKFYESGTKFMKDRNIHCGIDGCENVANYQGWVYTLNPFEDPTVSGGMIYSAIICKKHKRFLIATHKKPDKKKKK